MTPKSLLRHPGAVSALEELASGPFRAILPDEGVKKPAAILLCSGKVYYDLLKARGERKRDDVPILRLEQLYPLRRDELEKALSKYPPSTPARWVQEEPENMGAWPALRLWLGERLPGDLPFSVVARRAAASPATGSAASHELEQVDLIDRAFASESPAS
jgi:2-oxoglutarate dehydrogenase E1 component